MKQSREFHQLDTSMWVIHRALRKKRIVQDNAQVFTTMKGIPLCEGMDSLECHPILLASILQHSNFRLTLRVGHNSLRYKDRNRSKRVLNTFISVALLWLLVPCKLIITIASKISVNRGAEMTATREISVSYAYVGFW